jgi:hypothetical protein
MKSLTLVLSLLLTGCSQEYFCDEARSQAEVLNRCREIPSCRVTVTDLRKAQLYFDSCPTAKTLLRDSSTQPQRQPETGPE